LGGKENFYNIIKELENLKGDGKTNLNDILNIDTYK
jgi:endonuclease III-like uncharacterized protein